MKTELLIEHLLPNEANLIVEASQTDKSMYLKGIFMQAELKNRNGRIYPLTEMVNAVTDLNKRIKENNGVLGELDHPSDRLQVNNGNASHIIVETYMEGSNCVGKCKLLNTPAGLIAQEIYRNGIKPAVSSRGTGSVNHDGMVEGFSVCTVDLVTQNSAYGANPDMIYEGLQNKKIMTLAEQVQQDVDAQKYFRKEILKFIREITK